MNRYFCDYHDTFKAVQKGYAELAIRTTLTGKGCVELITHTILIQLTFKMDNSFSIQVRSWVWSTMTWMMI